MYKLIFLIAFLSSITAVTFSQSIITNFPQLNAGGYINAIWEDTLNNKIYIAGNFTAVNGSARKNLARLSHNPILNSYTVDAWAPITSMVGEIKCIAKYNDQLHIGGSFTSINGSALYSKWSIINITAVSLNASFNPDAGGPINDINDFAIEDTNLYVAGFAQLYDSGSSFRVNFGVFSLNAATPYPTTDPNTLNPSFNWGGTMEAVRLHLSGNRIYLCGRNFGGTLNDGIVAFDKTTLLQINSFNPSFTFEQVIDCETYNGKVYIVNSKIWPGGESVLEIDENTGAITTGAFNVSSGGTPYSIARYKNYLYIAGTYNFFQTQAQNYLGSVNLDSPSIPRALVNWITSPNTGFDNRYAVHCWRNKLYVSDNGLTNIAATPKNGMAAFCMEPYNPQILSTATAGVCPSSNYNYAIQNVPYATGYTWWYSGSNATITGNGTSSISIAFDETATSGTLYVSPYSKCNLYGDTLSYAITVYTRPNANAGIDSTLNCIRLNLDLQGNSTSSPVTYQWNGPSFSSSFQNPNITMDGDYILTVTNTSTGCTQKDTVTISQDTIRPDVVLPTGPFILTCIDTTVFLDGNSLTNPTIFYWMKQTSGTVYANPFYADSIGAYFLVVTNTRNGCKDSNYVTVGENRVAPQIEISSHAGITSLTIDTLTCFQDSILLIGNSSTSNTIFHWEDTVSVIGTDDSISIYISNAYALFVTDTINGCSSQQNFFIAEFKTAPQISLPTGATSITCSNDTVTLDGDAITTNTNLIWTGPGNFTSSDPALADTTGYFVLTGTRTDNGCFISDSVLVTQIPLIETSISNDTLVCAGSNVDLWVNVIGSFTNLNYSWTGTTQTTSIINVNPIITAEYFVTVTDGFGCAGFDSVTVNIPVPVSDSILTFASCDSTIGEIQIYATGGIPPYSYSIDNGSNFQISNIFNVPFGDYEIIIQDSLNCLYYDSATVSENSQLPEPDFLVSTYSFVGDTLVLVNISNPQPDSLEWVFPIGTDIILNEVETPWIILPDTGSYQISLKGIYSNCFSEKIKTVYVRQPDSTVADFFNQNGIDTLSVYPNPNNGIFDLEITLFRKQDFSILIYDLQGNRHFDSFVNESDYHLENIQLPNLPNGTYMIRVIAEFDARTVYFIINQ